MDTVSGGASDREGKEHADDVDIRALPSATLVLVCVLQFVVFAGQLLLGCDPTETPGGVGPVRSRLEIGQFVEGETDGLSHEAGFGDTVLFDRSDLRVGAQMLQVIVREFPGVTVDEFVLVGDIAWGGLDFGFGGVDVGLERRLLLEGNDVPSWDGFFGFGNGEKGGH